jgi:hypothetical protein
VAAAAAGYLSDASIAAVRVAADARAWPQALDALARAAATEATDAAPPDRRRRWRDVAEQTVMAFRAAAADLNERRKTYPDAAARLQPLADAKVYAAVLALAERHAGYEPGPPERLVPTPEDAQLKQTRELLSKVTDGRITDCPPDVRAAALNREWDVYAAYARQTAGEKPEQVVAALKLLAQCAANDAREAEYGKLVDELLPVDDARYPAARVELAEYRMAVGESEFGYRAIGQKKASARDGVRAMLVAGRDAGDAKTRGRANALLGELAYAVPKRTTQSNREALAYFRAGASAGRPGEPQDPVALMGLALFYQLDDQPLKAPEYDDPLFEELRRMTAGERVMKTLTLYQDAARSGDPHANFLAGQYTYLVMNSTPDKKTPENQRRVEQYLNAAVAKGHKRAATYLARVRRTAA